jgi:NADPH:quinone reductase-like Zn-dependent oxidoreductase
MRAVIQDRYGPPEILQIADVERPVPKEDEVLVRVHATTVNRTDTHLRAANRVLAVGRRVPTAEAADRRPRIRGRGRSGRRVREAVRSRRPGFWRAHRGERGAHLRPRDGPDRAYAGRQ